jgi:hypothetical protein
VPEALPPFRPSNRPPPNYPLLKTDEEDVSLVYQNYPVQYANKCVKYQPSLPEHMYGRGAEFESFF